MGIATRFSPQFQNSIANNSKTSASNSFKFYKYKADKVPQFCAKFHEFRSITLETVEHSTISMLFMRPSPSSSSSSSSSAKSLDRPTEFIYGPIPVNDTSLDSGN